MTSSEMETDNNPPQEGPQMKEVEEEFLHAVDMGDVTMVKALLEEFPNLNVDCTDALGRTPLRLAVKNENKEMVEILLCLSNPENMHEALLQAIDSGYTNIAEVTLRHPSYLEVSKRMRRMGETDLFFKPERGSQFPSYVTPLNLASQKNQFVIVQLLLQRGETITKPHKFDCLCQECINKNKFDQLRSAKCRLDAYRGLASEAYVSLSSKDPFLTAFELAHELRGLSKSEVFFKNEYNDLADQLSDYVVKLLDRVWTQRELSAVLDKTGQPQEDRFESLIRFKMAVDYEEKLFVSHPNCQQRIDRCWYEGLSKIGRADWARRFGLLFVSILVYPFLVACFLFAPKSTYGQRLTVPCVKFVSQTGSFVIFLILVIVTSVEAISKKNTLENKYPGLHTRWQEFCKQNQDACECGEDFPLRPTEATISELMVSVWILGMVVQECQEIWNFGIQAHLKDMFNILDLLLLSVYIATLTIRFWTVFKFDESLSILQSNNTILSQDLNKTMQYIYWLNADRRFWEPHDPINTAEGLFAVANILSFSRIVYLLPANETLGPLQISLGRMVKDILRFFALAVLVIAAFMVALTNLFWYYASRENIEMHSQNIDTPPAVKYYGNVLSTFRTVFWSIYGRSEAEAVTLGGYNNTVTESIGEVIDGMYNIVMVILLLNILIAMMSRSFDKIQEDADVEWKFARSALYLNYISEGRVLPVPLNVIEIPYDMVRSLVNLCQHTQEEPEEPHGPGGRRVAVSNFASERNPKRKRNANNLDDEPTPTGAPHVNKNSNFLSNVKSKTAKELTLYQEIIQCIIQRFIYDMQRQNEISGGTTDDIKHHFERMRYEVMTHYKNKDDSMTLAVAAVREIAEQVNSLSTDGTLKPVSWTVSSPVDSQHSQVTSTGTRSDISVNDFTEHYSDILCDVHEEPDEYEENGSDREELLSDHSSYSTDKQADLYAITVDNNGRGDDQHDNENPKKDDEDKNINNFLSVNNNNNNNNNIDSRRL